MTTDDEQPLRLKYIPLSVAVGWFWTANPKLHDIPTLAASLTRYGFQDPPKFDATLNGGKGAFSYGNGRVAALRYLHQIGEEPPRGIAFLDEEDDEWVLPVLFGLDLASEAVAHAFGVDHNNLTLGGSVFTELDAVRLWDRPLFAKLLGTFEGSEIAFPLSASPLVLNAFASSPFQRDEEEDTSPPADYEPPTDSSSPPGVRFIVGTHTFQVERDTYQDWLETLRDEVGFEPAALEAEVKRRLGYAIPAPAS